MIAAHPSPTETISTWAKRAAAQQRLASRTERGTRLLALIQRMLSWPAERISIVHGPAPRYETFAFVDDIRFWLITESGTDYLLVAGFDEWFEVRNAAELGELMRSGKLQGAGE